MTEPASDEVNAIPSSTALESLDDAVTGVPEIRLYAVPVGAGPTVVNDQEPPESAVVLDATTTEYDVPPDSVAVGVKVNVLVPAA